MRGAGPDENIKNDERKVETSDKTTTPQEKGGPKTPGARACKVIVDNRTQYPVDIYADGDYRGTVASYGDGVLYAGNGVVQLYGRTVFTDGTSQVFGPSEYYCSDSGIRWSLTY